MEHTRISDTNHPLFGRAWALYVKSFPPQERRRLGSQRKIMDNPLYRFEVVTEGDLFVGIVLWWGFDDVRYVEHLATEPRLRGQGRGRRILDEFTSGSDVPVLLEVELPEDETSRRRIGFYERAGFVLNEHPYTHPPYKRGGERVPLMLMTWPAAITAADAERFCGRHHPTIHEMTHTRDLTLTFPSA